MKHRFEKGETVVVINRSISGKYFREGVAKIIHTVDREDTYAVRFEGEDQSIVTRYVDPLVIGTVDLQNYVNGLNKLCGADRFPK